MSGELLKEFQSAYRNLELLPLVEAKELDRFRVDYSNEIIEDLEQLVEDSPSANSKIIFTGHRGCGKSTLLAEFGRRLADRYFVIFFSISDTIEMSDVNHINILFAIAVNLMEEAEKNQIKISNSAKENFHRWFATKTKIDTKASGSDSFDLNLFNIIKLKLKAEASVREEIKQEFRNNISDLVARINEIAAIIYGDTKKDVLVMIDDLDKLDLAVAKEIYYDHIKALFQPNFRMILTIPVAALREVRLITTIETEANNQIVPMSVAKLFAKGENRLPDAVPIPQTMAILSDVLSKRIPSKLIEPQAANQIIIRSGGLLRELIRIANECCKICLLLLRRDPQRTDIKIDNSILQEAIKKLRLNLSVRLGSADYEMLQTVYQKNMPNDPKEQRFLDLLHDLYVLEYRNDRVWYDVHPIVVDLLKERGLIK